MAVYLGDSKVLISRIGSEVVFVWSPHYDTPRLTTSEDEQILDSNSFYLIADGNTYNFGGE